MEAARAVRPELTHLAPGRADLDRVLREPLTMDPTPIARVRDVLVSDAHLETWLADLLADPEFRPAEARRAPSGDAPVRHRCQIDGNYVWYRAGRESVPACPDHGIALEPAPLARHVDAAALRELMADRIREWITTGDPGGRPASELEDEALDLLATTTPGATPRGRRPPRPCPSSSAPRSSPEQPRRKPRRRAAETGDNTLLEEALFLGTTALGALVGTGDITTPDVTAATASALVRWHDAREDTDALNEAIEVLHSAAEAGSAWPFLPVILETAPRPASHPDRIGSRPG